MAVVAGLAAFGAIGGTARLLGWIAWSRPVAVTALAFIVVVAVAFLVWAWRGLRTAPFFIAACATVLLLAGVTLATNEQRRENAHAMAQALQLSTTIDRFITAMARLEAVARNYSLTGAEAFVERVTLHRASAQAAMAALEAIAADHPEETRRIAGLRPLLDHRLAAIDAEMRARREHGAEAATQAMLAGIAGGAEQTRAAIEALRNDTAERIVTLRGETQRTERIARLIVLTGSAVTVALVLAAFYLVKRAHDELRRANEALEDRVRERTAQMHASAAEVRDREQRLRFLADSLPQLVWTARQDGSIESLNRGYVEFLGAASEADAVAALHGVVHADDQPETSREWQAMFRENRSGGGELRLRRADGVYRWHLWRAHPEHDASGAVARWVGTSTDIHEKKLAEERLEHRMAEQTAEFATSEERFRQAFDFAGTGMAIVGLDGRWLRVNRSLCEILGYSEAELLQKTFQEITHPDDLKADLTHVRDLLDDRTRFYQHEKRYVHRNSQLVWVRLTVSLVRDAAGKPVHFVFQVEDITERKRLEANLAAARDQAVEASRMKSEFLATMSHEIRTPMNGVIGMTSLLRDTPLTAAQAEYVRTIETSGETLLAIINDILDYSKIEAGRVELEVVPFDLGECIGSALDLFAAGASEKKIRLSFATAPDVPVNVAGDVTRLRQILVNLIGNAVKFTPSGEITVSVAAARPAETQDGRTRQLLRFAVKDTGIGIAPEGMSRLFKSFSQVDASTTRRFGGTGLGLAISKRLAEVMGGTMWAESAPGRGSTFCFTVSLEFEPERGPARTPAVMGTLPGGVQETLGARCPLRILLAEDNPVNQRVANLLLQRLGYHAVVVANGAEALGALEAADYDVILMDVEMPELDGCEATRRIRASGRSSTRPWIIALTAGAMPGDRERAMSAGMNDYLTKPVRAEAISASLLRAFAVLAATAGREGMAAAR